MKIVYVASEMVPYAKTGGLADVAGTLPQQIQNLGHEVLAFLPRYKEVDARKWNLATEIDRLEIPLGTENEPARIFSHCPPGGIKTYFVDHPEMFMRDELYGTPLADYPDNDRRFTLFQRSVVETLIRLDIKPEIIHCHDWQTGLIPVYMRSLYAKHPAFRKTKTVFTIHNLAYQGNFPPDSLPATGLGWEHFRMERLEFYGKVSFLKAGIVDADAVTTVSPSYAKEIQTKEFGSGLEGVLKERSDKICGIVNGIDHDLWNPETDKALAARFSLGDISGKAVCKKELQKENEFKIDPEIPVLGIISRLVDQKGIDILAAAIPSIMELGFQLVLLGTGDEKYHQLLRHVAKKYTDQLGIHIVFDAKMAKRIYAGSDFFLVPSYYEPCGLGQMIALRYGTVPIVRETGGLADTIHEYNAASGRGNGFLFRDYSPDALVDAVRHAGSIFKDEAAWNILVRNALQCDYSWTASARQYVDLYRQLHSRKVSDRGKS